MTPIRFCFETLGCKVNQYETQALETILASRGHTAGIAGEGCDAVIVNTCAVTAESGRKSRQAVRRLKKLEPDAVVAVCGCFSQVSPEEIEALGADLVSGSGDRLLFIDALERVYTRKQSCLEKSSAQLIGSPAEKRDADAFGMGESEERTMGVGDRNDAPEVCADAEKTAEDHLDVGLRVRHGVDEARAFEDGRKRPQQLIDDPAQRRLFEELPAGSVAGRTRAMLKIQDGCQNFCAYCIIPYARGPVRSLPLDRAVFEAKHLNAEGYSEIVVTGIEISSYGKDLKNDTLPRSGTSLVDAIKEISAAAPDARIRLGSLEPRTITEDFCDALSRLPNICDHFHLSLQSGCDETLRRMKRRYTTADFDMAVQLLRRHYPSCGITADLIVGFPGETDEEFEKTLRFIKHCNFSAMHIFPYSKRPGTPAAVMPQQIDKTVKRERAKIAAEAAAGMARAYTASCVGTVLAVLFEREANGQSFGHAGNYLEVCVDGTGLRNTLLPVRIICEKDRLLFGEIIKP